MPRCSQDDPGVTPRAFAVSDAVAVAASPLAGRGVFARCVLPAGFEVACCPVLLLPEGDPGVEFGAVLSDYVFDLGGPSGLLLGVGSLLNHEDEPNCEVVFDDSYEFARVLTVCPVGPGVELTIDYGPEFWSDRLP